MYAQQGMGFTQPDTGSGWTDVFQSLALTGGQIAKSVAMRPRPGEFFQSAESIRAFGVPGAVSSAQAWPGIPSSSGFGTGTLMLLVAGVVVVAMLMKGR